MLSNVTSCDHTKSKIAFNHVLVNKDWVIVSSSLHTLQERHLQAEVKSSGGDPKMVRGWHIRKARRAQILQPREG